MKNSPIIQIKLPDWVTSWKEENETQVHKKRSHEELMDLALSLGLRHLEERTGGPFAALVYEEQKGRIVSLGVNLVVALNNSCLHAETTALMFAQLEEDTFSLGGGDYSLIVTAQPCAMCFGAIPWSGIKKLVYGSPKEDIELIAGFNEGDVPERWEDKLEKRGISVYGPLYSEKTRILLETYRAQVEENKGAVIY